MRNRTTSTKNLLILLVLVLAFIFAGCATTNDPAKEETPTVKNLTAEEGKAMMEEDPAIILVDVRTQEEFAEQHISGALLIPVDELGSLAPEMISDKNATYIIYCRSGNRSATAASQLIDMGYKNIYDMGGIIDWPYETVTGI